VIACPHQIADSWIRKSRRYFTMTRDTALLRLQNRTDQLARLMLLGAPDIIIQEQRRMIRQAAGWVENPPPEIPD